MDNIEHIDESQKNFDSFIVPDRSRILKIKKHLINYGYLHYEHNIDLLEIGYSTDGLIDNLEEYSNVNKYATDLFEKTMDIDVNFQVCDLNRNFPKFNTVEFDIVFAGEVIEHLYNDKKFLKQVYKSLKPGGVFVITTPNLFFFVNRFTFIFGKMPYFAYEDYHYHFYSIPVLSKLVEEAGFFVEGITSTHILFSSRRYRKIGKFFEYLAELLPSLGAHIILFAKK